MANDMVLPRSKTRAIRIRASQDQGACVWAHGSRPHGGAVDCTRAVDCLRTVSAGCCGLRWRRGCGVGAPGGLALEIGSVPLSAGVYHLGIGRDGINT